MTTSTHTTDKFGRHWPPHYEVCQKCGQPDNCGDCNHARLTGEQASELGALTPSQIEADVERYGHVAAWR